jgi:hypothetical protein
MSNEPESLTVRLLREMRVEMSEIRAKMATKADLGDLRSELKTEMNTLRADVASDMVVLRKDISDQVAGLRRTVVDYHSSVIGHGTLISDLEARMRRVEQHLNLPTIDTH